MDLAGSALGGALLTLLGTTRLEHDSPGSTG